MAIQYGPGYDPTDQGSSGTGVTVVATWDDLNALEPAAPGLTRQVTSIPGYGVVDMLARRGAQSWFVPGSQPEVRAYITANPIPLTSPTVPGRKRILGRSSSFNGGLFDGDGNYAGWWAYGAAGVTGPTDVSLSHRFVNQTGKTITKIAIPLFGMTPGSANILAVWIGTGGSTYDADSWQRMTFNAGADTTYQLADGTNILPDYVVTDTLTLDTPCLPLSSFVVRIVYDSVGQVTMFDSFGTMQNSTSGLCQGWIGIGNAGASEGDLNNPVTWYGNWPSSMCHVFVEFSDNDSTEVSILAFGDSVINQFVYYLDPLAGNRDQWQYSLELLVTDNTYHLATAGNGGFELPQYCDRLKFLLPLYNPWVDIYCVGGWSSNNMPTTNEAANAWRVKLEELHTAVVAANHGWSVIFPVPVGAAIAGKDQFQYMLDYANTSYSGKVLDCRSAIWDPNNHDNFLPAYTSDDIHLKADANEVFATYLKTQLETNAIASNGYVI
jgi:hypothetical protein